MQVKFPGMQPKPKTPLEKFEEQSKESQKRIGEQYQQAHEVLGASRDVGREQLKEEFARQKAITGAPGGAQTKMLGKAISGLERGFGQEAAGLKSQEAATRLEAEQQAAQMGLQESQFARQLGFQEKEFQENLRTNFINTAVALRNAGLQTAQQWAHLLKSGGIMSQIYGNRAPTVSSKYQSGQMGFLDPRTHQFT